MCKSHSRIVNGWSTHTCVKALKQRLTSGTSITAAVNIDRRAQLVKMTSVGLCMHTVTLQPVQPGSGALVCQRFSDTLLCYRVSRRVALSSATARMRRASMQLCKIYCSRYIPISNREFQLEKHDPSFVESRNPIAD
jgi:hypothetical protein